MPTHRTKFWGIFIAWVRWDALRVSAGLTHSKTSLAGYRYRLMCQRPPHDGGGVQLLDQSDEVGARTGTRTTRFLLILT